MVEETEKKKFSIDFKRITKFVVAFLLINFLFFGWICNTGLYDSIQLDPNYIMNLMETEYIREPRLLFVYTNLWDFTNTFTPMGIHLPPVVDFVEYLPGAFSILILFFIGIYQGYQEDFMVYSIKNNFWMVPFIVLLSWIWSAVVYVGTRNIFQIIGDYFSSYHGYLNIIFLVIWYTSAGIVGGILKSYFYQKAHAVEAGVLAEEEASEEIAA
ncbi:hypothetical protein NEF87_000723 [Candidatus Lokiarchaeum ossiferum]|uniref:Uncharacterized protein n=1 Tax=Candidatus Lokiarchaeum ossiferum TaxID=2951803 RepID=A0ABY6HLQ1_9ARCH|nr:hypothetical protein NEF87_000723 [Candidatus Lokiarchaeum sp. B-35]